MATNFPGSVDNFSNPAATDSLNSPSHSSQHADANDAIEAIETYVLANPTGLVHIETASFSASSAVNINDVFSSTYDNYRILVSLTASTGAPSQTFRLRVGGSDETGSNYTFQQLEIDNTTVAGARTSSTTAARYMWGSSTSKSTSAVDIFAPFLAEPTLYFSNANWQLGTNLYNFAGSHSLTTSYTGLTLIVGTGSITGFYSIYGYRKA